MRESVAAAVGDIDVLVNNVARVGDDEYERDGLAKTVEVNLNAVADQWAYDGIGVNAVAPGFVETAMTDWTRSDGKSHAALPKTVPQRRFGKPQEVAIAVRSCRCTAMPRRWPIAMLVSMGSEAQERRP